MMDQISRELLIAAENGDQNAIQTIRQKADNLEPDAQYWLAWFYWEGKVVQQDIPRAGQLFLAAAEAGHVVAQFNTATAYLQGNGFEKDAAEALRWARMAAEAGYVDAQFMLAVLLSKDQAGMSCDRSESAKWCQRAAEQGHPGAQSLLNMLKGKQALQLSSEDRFSMALEKFQRTSIGREQSECVIVMSLAAKEGAENATTFFQEAYRRFRTATENLDFDEIARTVGFLQCLVDVGAQAISKEFAITSTELMQPLVGGDNPDVDAIERFKKLISQEALDGNDMAAMLLEVCPPD